MTGQTKAATTPVLYVYDFCASNGRGNFVKGPTAADGVVIDKHFMDTYAQTDVQGLPAFELEIFAMGYPLSADSTWYAAIHNFHTGQWESLSPPVKGLAKDERGWSVFETYYQAGQCSEQLPPLCSRSDLALQPVEWEVGTSQSQPVSLRHHYP